jgi:hypothetical protein
MGRHLFGMEHPSMLTEASLAIFRFTVDLIVFGRPVCYSVQFFAKWCLVCIASRLFILF